MLARARSFFGCYEVVASEQRTLRYLNHGNIVHGGQCVSSILRDVPILYYHPSGPTGQVLQQYNRQRNVRVGIVGMGAGMVAAYSRFSHEYVFFEIDPVVIRIARDPHLFTYLADARGKIRVVCGDGRLGLAAEPEHSFDVLMFDAYSSDAIPVHLLTREAMQLFLSRLKPGGIMLFHLSNRYLRLEPVLGNLCEDLELTAVIQDHEPDEKKLPPSEVGLVSSSRWALVASESANLVKWLPDPRWKLLSGDPRVGVWTDQFSSILSVFRK
ncbi:MAG TPA: fused MFS/spermidine synthase [Candidatus Ozemobacteraceae bacterium]|nr:fused MFS/spermidine synthase [Candidatus Ozemobacteraceae bacterium]